MGFFFEEVLHFAKMTEISLNGGKRPIVHLAAIEMVLYK